MAGQRLLLLVKSYFARGGTEAEPGVTSSAGSGASQECGLGRGAAASCRRDARRSRPRAPCPSLPLFAAGPRRPPRREESPGGKREPARFAVLFQKSEFEMREFGKLCGGIIEDERRVPAARERASWGYVPMVEVPPERRPVGRRGTVEASALRRHAPTLITHCSLIM